MKKKILKNLSMVVFGLFSNRLKNEISCYSLMRQLPPYTPFLLKNKQQNNPILLVNRGNRFPPPHNSNQFAEIQLITIDLASPNKIKEWAEKKLPNGKIFGQVTNPNTLHYKTLKPLKGGLFCERIFGPIKDFECSCGIHKQKPFHRIINFQNKQFCTKCDIEYTWSDIRRYQLGYIELVTPITHLWYLKGMPSYIRSVLGAKKKYIEGIAYCSEIVSLDKAWKPNRLIPFPEENYKKIKTIVDYNYHKNHIGTYKLINNNHFKNLDYNTRNIKYLNRQFIKKKILEPYKLIRLQSLRGKISSIQSKNEKQWSFSKFFIEEYNKNVIKSNNIKETKCLEVNPFFYNIENCSYQTKIDFYKKVCCSFIKLNLEKKTSTYALKILYGSLSDSNVSAKMHENFYNINNIIVSFKKKFLICRFSNIYIFTKLKRNKKLFDYINSKKIYIQKNFFYFKTEKVINYKLFNGFKLFTLISSDILSYYVKNNNNLSLKKKGGYSDKALSLKMQFLNKKFNVKNYNTFLNNFILLSLNFFSLDYFKKHIFFSACNKYIKFKGLKMIRYDLFTIFIMPITIIIDTIIFKSYIESKTNILIEDLLFYSRKTLNSEALLMTPHKKIKTKFFVKNLSIFEEASEIMWHRFWNICYFFTYTKMLQRLRKQITKYHKIFIHFRNSPSLPPSSLPLLKKIIKKIKIDKIFSRNSYYPNFKIKIKNRLIKDKFSLFINIIKIYFKKILFLYQITSGNSQKKKISELTHCNFLILFLKYFKNKIKKIFIKFLSLELLPWIFSQFALTWFYKQEKPKFNYENTASRREHHYLKMTRRKINLINKIQINSFCKYQTSGGDNNKKIFGKKISFNYSGEEELSKFFQNYYEFKQKLCTYKNQIQFFLKYRKCKLFLNGWFSNLKKNCRALSNSNGTDYFFINSTSSLNKINFKNTHNMLFLFYQKRLLLKKKQVFYNYFSLKKFNFSQFYFKFFNNVLTSSLIYSSFLKREVVINILSIQLKKFYCLNFIKKNNKFFRRESDSHNNSFYISKYFKKFSYFYSFILFSSVISNRFTLSLLHFNNDKFFFNLTCFLIFAKKNFFKNHSWFKKKPTFFYSLNIFQYQQQLQQKSMLKFAKKNNSFDKFINLINYLLFYYNSKFKVKNQNNIIKLIKKNRIYILYYIKKFQIKLLNKIQKDYFYQFENKKYFQIEMFINNFKNHLIFIHLKTSKNNLLSDDNKFTNTNISLLDSELIHLNFKKFFNTSHHWEIIMNIFKNRISQTKFQILPFSQFYKQSIKIKSFSNYSMDRLRDTLYFNSFCINHTFYNLTLIETFFSLIKKNKILQTRQQYCRMLKSNNLFFLCHFKNNWDYFVELPKKKNKLLELSNLFFFLFYYQSQQTRKKHSIRRVSPLNKQNFYFINFYLKFLKHDLNKNFNEAIFSVISESRKMADYSMIWNNIYSLSNRYCWKSDLALNNFLCYMLSPENPSDILIPLYKKRIHNSNVLREEPPIAGGAVILKFLEEFDIPEMKKIDIQLQTILKKIPNKLHEIAILLKHYKTNLKFLKYYSIKKRALIEIEKSILRKLKYIRRLNWVSARPQFMIIRNLPVLPADLRPIFKIQQQLTASDLNRLYQKIMYRNDRLKRFLKNSTTSNSFEMLFAQRMLQEAVDNLIENGKDMNSIEVDTRGRPLKSLGELLKGKKGRFRQNLLGKRVDYSGRSVIVVGPKLQLHECGLPVEMAIELFLPFLIKEILKNKYSLTVRSAKLYIKTHRIQITQLLRLIVKKQPILLNRAPTLHRLGIQAFLPKLVEGKAILLHPLVCSAFNADFDGDQMAVHVPITNEARIEAWKLVLSRNNLLSPATGEPVLLPSQDMVLGCYYLTIEDFKSFIQKQQDIYRKIHNQSYFIFKNFENILNAYQRNEIHLHTNIWVIFNNNIESESIYQEPKELQIQRGGQYIKIYPDYYQKFTRKGKMYNQIIKTTTGRILFNIMLNNCFN